MGQTARRVTSPDSSPPAKDSLIRRRSSSSARGRMARRRATSARWGARLLPVGHARLRRDGARLDGRYVRASTTVSTGGNPCATTSWAEARGARPTRGPSSTPRRSRCIWGVPSQTRRLQRQATLSGGSGEVGGAIELVRLRPGQPRRDPNPGNVGPHDYRSFVDRSDVLTFDTTPLVRDTEVTGLIVAEIHLSCDAPDTDLWVRLSRRRARRHGLQPHESGCRGAARELSKRGARTARARTRLPPRARPADHVERVSEGAPHRVQISPACGQTSRSTSTPAHARPCRARCARRASPSTTPPHTPRASSCRSLAVAQGASTSVAQGFSPAGLVWRRARQRRWRRALALRPSLPPPG